MNHTTPASADAPETTVLDPLYFHPVSVRHRVDGWTPERQRQFVDALAETGHIGEACRAVGMSEQSLSRLRRRADGKAFMHVCDIAMASARQRLVSIAYQRAIEGTPREIYYHGECVGTTRVFDNRMLLQLIARADRYLDGPDATGRLSVWDQWTAFTEDDIDPDAVLAEQQAQNEADAVAQAQAEEAEEQGAGDDAGEDPGGDARNAPDDSEAGPQPDPMPEEFWEGVDLLLQRYPEATARHTTIMRADASGDLASCAGAQISVSIGSSPSSTSAQESPEKLNRAARRRLAKGHKKGPARGDCAGPSGPWGTSGGDDFTGQE